jgi:hypothetical protein
VTTIAADFTERVMCSDSKWTDGNQIGQARKVFTVRGELFGFCGTLSDIDPWLKAWEAERPLPKAKLSVLRLNEAGLHTWEGGDNWTRLRETRFAMGTGGKCARGAMAAGASCREAVRIATTIDADSGGPVRQYKL